MSRVIRTPYEDCDLHQALMNTGYAIHRRDYYEACEANGFKAGMYTGKVIDYYAPAINYATQRYESATLSQLYERDRRLGTDFVGDLARDLRGFGGDPLYKYFY